MQMCVVGDKRSGIYLVRYADYNQSELGEALWAVFVRTVEEFSCSASELIQSCCWQKQLSVSVQLAKLNVFF